jgi:amino acid transporter
VVADDKPEALVRNLSIVGLWLLVINGMIGAGIFGLPAEAARLTGAWSPFVFLLCGLLIAPVKLTFAQLASYFGGTGGPILYARTAFGPLVGFQTGWAFYVARATALAANLNLLLSSAALFVDSIDHGAARIVGLFLLCFALTAVNVVGTRHAIGSVGVLTVLKFVPLLAIVFWGAPHVAALAPPLRATPFPDGASLGAAMLLMLYAFVGFESALVPAGEARDPARDMPRALLWSLAIVTLLYMLIQAVCVAVLPDIGATSRPLVDAAAALFGPAGTLIMSAGVIVSVGGNVAGAMFSTPRMTYALARDGQLPAVFAAVHPTFKTPSVSIVVFGVLVFALAIAGSFTWLAATSVLIRLLIYLTCIAATPRLRNRFADLPHAVRLPGGYALPALAAALCVWLLTQVSMRSVTATAALLAVGVVLFTIARMRPGART